MECNKHRRWNAFHSGLLTCTLVRTLGITGLLFLDGAQSEKVVPSGHPAHQNPQGMEEVDRILRLNLRSES